MDSLQTQFFKFFIKTKKKLVRFLSSIKLFIFNKKSNQEQLDKNLIYSLSASNIPNQEQLRQVNRLLSKKEKIIILVCGILLLANLIYLGHRAYNRYFQSFPKSGGIYVEGVLGWPRFINPLYSSDRDVDADLAKLIYSSLFTYNNSGELVGDLVTDWEVSEDGLEYLINIRSDVRWHGDGNLTADDVIFTFYLMKNPNFRSPWQRQLVGIDLEKIDDFSLKFILQEPYAPFFNLLTFGILPEFIWGTITPDSILLTDLNLKPIGSGPFKFKSLLRNKAGEIKEYRLTVNSDYYGRQPYLQEIIFKFYSDYPQLVGALNDKKVDGIAYLPPYLKKDILAKNSLLFHHLDLPQVTGLFFNQEKNKNLADKNLRQSLAMALNRDQLISEALLDFAQRSDGPLPFSNFAYNHQLNPQPYNIEQANELLAVANWELIIPSQLENSEENSKIIEKINNLANDHNLDINQPWRLLSQDDSFQEVLVVYLSFPNNTENFSLANLIKQQWEALGVQTILQPLSVSQITEEILKDKNFEILLQRQIIGSDPDVASFWHSAQTQTGLNLVNYRNSEVDNLLIKARQTINDQEARINHYNQFQEILITDLPAIFLFSPVYPYVQDRRVKGFSTVTINNPSDRFSSISEWYVKTSKRFIRN